MNTSLITMGAANVIVLEETFKSLSTICDEIVYGDLLLFPDDREILYTYQKDYNLKIIQYPFDYIFKNGFSAILNDLASHASNDRICYMNTSERIQHDYGVKYIITNNPECNSFYFVHETDPHRWFRFYNKKDLHWSGVIHEQLCGEFRPYHKPIFMMEDLPKDMYSTTKANAADSVKEIVYFTNYMKLKDDPRSIGETDTGWINFVEQNYDGFSQRLKEKGKMYDAFVEGDYYKLMEAIYEKKPVKFKSNIGIEYQNDNKFLGK